MMFGSNVFQGFAAPLSLDVELILDVDDQRLYQGTETGKQDRQAVDNYNSKKDFLF